MGRRSFSFVVVNEEITEPLPSIEDWIVNHNWLTAIGIIFLGLAFIVVVVRALAWLYVH